MLCATCISIFQTDLGNHAFPVVDGLHHISIANVRAAAKLGCYLCSELELDYEDGDEDEDEDASVGGETENGRVTSQVSFELRFYVTTSPEGRLGMLSFASADGKLTSASYEMVYTEGLAKPRRYDDFLRQTAFDLLSEPWRVRDDGFASSTAKFAESTGDPQVLGVAGKWLKRCLEEHTECEAVEYSSGAPWVPKRLLDLALDAGEVRLIETKDEKPEERYATLSHCWGEDPICCLTADNMDEWHEKIPLDVLTNTFRDAIAATRMLNIRYLWIDSLCIQQAGQGSTEDWQDHAVAMRLVYTNSLVNIAAARAECGADGAFTTRSDTFLRPCHVLCTWPSKLFDFPKDAIWTVRKSSRHGSHAIRTLPLYTRGWVVQERFLAPRVLHFANDRIFWECNELPMVEESFPEGFTESCPEYDSTVYWPFNLNQHIQGSIDQAPHDPTWVGWQEMINEYTRCDLSFPDKDVFVALAGVAEKFGQSYDNEYLAGHFRQHLPFDLLWQNKGERATTYRAPSWSWASIDGQAHLAVAGCPYCDECCVRFAAVKDARVELESEKIVYGQVKKAELVLSGHLMPCTIEPSKTVGTGLRQKLKIFPYLEFDQNLSPDPASRESSSIIYGEADIDDETDSTSGFRTVSDMFTAWVLPIIELKPEHDSVQLRHQGLLLKKNTAGEFVRLGIYRVRERVMDRVLKVRSRGEQDVCIV